MSLLESSPCFSLTALSVLEKKSPGEDIKFEVRDLGNIQTLGQHIFNISNVVKVVIVAKEVTNNTLKGSPNSLFVLLIVRRN